MEWHLVTTCKILCSTIHLCAHKMRCLSRVSLRPRLVPFNTTTYSWGFSVLLVLCFSKMWMFHCHRSMGSIDPPYRRVQAHAHTNEGEREGGLSHTSVLLIHPTSKLDPYGFVADSSLITWRLERSTVFKVDSTVNFTITSNIHGVCYLMAFHVWWMRGTLICNKSFSTYKWILCLVLPCITLYCQTFLHLINLIHELGREGSIIFKCTSHPSNIKIWTPPIGLLSVRLKWPRGNWCEVLKATFSIGSCKRSNIWYAS